MKEFKVQIPDGYEIDKEKSTFENIVFKLKKNILPNTWKDFCDNNPIKQGECFFNSSNIEELDIRLEDSIKREYDYISAPNIQTAKAIKALCKLIYLRDCYRQGWKPDFNDNNYKFVIIHTYGTITLSTYIYIVIVYYPFNLKR